MDVASRSPVRRLAATEVLEMVRCGQLGEDDHVELLDGALLAKEPQGSTHAALAAEAGERLRAAAGPNTHVRLHSPLAATADSLPEPDVALCRGPATRYLTAHPTGADVLLVIEVATTLIERDLDKARVYARARVPEYWLLDVPGRRLLAHSEPGPDGRYLRRIDLRGGDRVRVPGAGGAAAAELAVAELLA